MSRVGVLFLSIVFLSSCTKDSLKVNDSADTPGGAAIDETVWKHDNAIDTAISTMSGKELLNHLQGLSDYVDGVSKKVNRRETKAVETLPALQAEIEQNEDMSFFREYMKKQYILGDRVRSNHLPFQELSEMAIRIQLTNLKIEARDSAVYSEDRP